MPRALNLLAFLLAIGGVAAEGTPRRLPARPEHSGVSVAAFSPDGRVLATCGRDGEVRLWDESYRRLATLRHGASVECACFSDDGRRLLLGGGDGRVSVWEVPSGKLLGRMEAAGPEVVCVAFSTDGKLAAAGTSDGEVVVWELPSGKRLHRVSGHTKAVLALAFSVDGASLASGGKDRTVRLWDIATGRSRAVLEGHTDLVTALAFAPDGKTLASADADDLALWDVATGRRRHLLRKGYGIALHLAWSADGKSVLVARSSGLNRWAADGKLLASARWPEGGGVHAVAAGGRAAAILTRDRAVVLRSATPWDRLAAQWHLGPVLALTWSPDGATLASGGADGRIFLWSPDRPTPQASVMTGTPSSFQGVVALTFAPDGRSLAVADTAMALRWWDIASGRQLAGTSSEVPLCELAYSPDGRTLAAIPSDHARALLWETSLAGLPTGGPPRNVEGAERCDWRHAAWVRDGRALTLIENYTTISLRHPRTGEELAVVPNRGIHFRVLTTTPDGKAVLAMDGNGVLLLYDAAAHQVRASIDTRRTDVTRLAVAADGRTVVLGSANGFVSFWDLFTGKLLDRVGRDGNGMDALALRPDCRTLAVAGRDGEILLYDVPRPPAAGSLVGELPPVGALADKNAEVAHQAIVRLALSPAEAVSHLRRRLAPIRSKAGPRIDRLIADLEGEDFAVREAAHKALTEMGIAAAPALRRALADSPSAELRRRARELLAAFDRGEQTPDELRAIRATEVLERIATPEARQLLEEWARGDEGAPLTEEAHASLGRLGRRLR